MNRIIKLVFALIVCVGYSSAYAQTDPLREKQARNPYYSHTDIKPVRISNAQWKKVLTPGEYQIGREAATERAFTGEYHNNHKKGIYYCAACGNLLFYSDTKFESGTGWPSFFRPAGGGSVALKTDPDGSRTEVECKRCGAHLGHVFDDGPKPTGKRYCMNSAILDFVATSK